MRAWTVATFLLASSAAALAPDIPSPSDLYGELYQRVEMERVFADSKTFADATATSDASAILAEYRTKLPKTREALADFVRQHFELPRDAATAPGAAARRTLAQHIADLWPQLVRPPTPESKTSSQLGFGFRHVVPGGRFREIYYWDSYFTLLGLVRDGHADLVRDMVDGFSDLIGRYGHVPNGTRSYYLSRSQPPFFFMMVSLLPEQDQPRYLTALRAEHAFWMNANHTVALDEGMSLNRYYDARDIPRDEAYRADVELAVKSKRPPTEIYRELRSAAESGWDFSSRWLADGKTMETIETTNIVPVDLNALLYGLEHAIEHDCAMAKDERCVTEFSRLQAKRKAAMDRFLWDADCGCYLDYQWRRKERTQRLSAATLYPLFTGAASKTQATSVAKVTHARLLAPGGLSTTTTRTGQQWDAPNGWAPLQWIAVAGLRNYGEEDLAKEIATRWLDTVEASYDATGKLVEKYNLQTRGGGGGGEYPLQDGFGWTNGVTRALMDYAK